MLPRHFEPEAYWRILLRRKWYAILLFLVTVTVGTVYVFVTPKTYRASTLILVQRQTVPERYVNPTVTDTLGDRINTIRQQVTSRTNLEALIKKFNLYSPSNPLEPEMIMQDKVELMTRNIQVDVHRGTAFTISFIYDNPKKVTEVANALTSNFIDENLRVREAQSIGTTEFLDTGLALSAHVRAALREHQERHGVNNTIESAAGQVTLRGIVLNEKEKAAAGQVTAAVPGVKGLDNQLRVMATSRLFPSARA